MNCLNCGAKTQMFQKFCCESCAYKYWDAEDAQSTDDPEEWSKYA